MPPALLLTCAIWISQAPAQSGQEMAARIDQFTSAHWKQEGLKSAELTADNEFLRRVTLDLVGRVPTAGEQAAFAADGSPDKRARAIARLMDSPEFSHHFGAVLDEIIQGKNSGDGAFVDYLRRAVGEGRAWDAIFREIMLGPWEADRKPAEAFLRKRLRSIDDLTTDTTVAFFGINISCAKCHDHPLVQDWKQRHYYGMASFLHRTTEDKNKKLGEKTSGDVQFVDTKGGRHTAPIMFLTGTVIDPTAKPTTKQDDKTPPAEKKTEKAEPPEKKPDPAKPEPAEKEKKERDKKKASEKPPAPSPFSARQALVDVALKERAFFSRAIANRLWAYFLGRGLVHPVDQMHSENPSSIPGLVEWLGDDLAAHQYDLRRLVAAIVQSRAYQLSSRWPGGAAGGPAFRAGRAAAVVAAAIRHVDDPGQRRRPAGWRSRPRRAPQGAARARQPSPRADEVPRRSRGRLPIERRRSAVHVEPSGRAGPDQAGGQKPDGAVARRQFQPRTHRRRHPRRARPRGAGRRAGLFGQMVRRAARPRAGHAGPRVVAAQLGRISLQPLTWGTFLNVPVAWWAR